MIDDRQQHSKEQNRVGNVNTIKQVIKLTKLPSSKYTNMYIENKYHF